MKRMHLLFFFFLPLLLSSHAIGMDSQSDQILGSCATLLIDNYDRTRNIEMAIGRLQGLVIEPGRVFSFNRAVGRRTARRGYLPAPVLFQDKKSIQIGGGICQVSSTLYNAVLLSDLEVVERHRHSSPVTYLPLGLDATVAYGYKDLKFKNTLPIPIRISTAIAEDILTISILGKEKMPYEIEIITRVTEIEAPFPDRTAEPGKEVMRYRIRKRDGVVLEQEYLGRDYFHPVRGEP
ncbi:MAG: VanW family protein [Deltaproteobacteria bacterium]|nr:VanW family protein [Deltaproteobacteria bacterium]